MPQYIRKQAHRVVHRRVRRKVSGTTERPRLAVHFSGQHVYAQLIDDTKGLTLASASTADPKAGRSRRRPGSARRSASLAV